MGNFQKHIHLNVGFQAEGTPTWQGATRPALMHNAYSKKPISQLSQWWPLGVRQGSWENLQPPKMSCRQLERWSDNRVCALLERRENLLRFREVLYYTVLLQGATLEQMVPFLWSLGDNSQERLSCRTSVERNSNIMGRKYGEKKTPPVNRWNEDSIKWEANSGSE